MAKEKYYRQCTLSKDDRRTTGWIEERGAIKGSKVNMELTPGTGISEFWTVENVSNIRLSGEVLLERSHDYTRTRKASDI